STHPEERRDPRDGHVRDARQCLNAHHGIFETDIVVDRQLAVPLAQIGGNAGQMSRFVSTPRSMSRTCTRLRTNNPAPIRSTTLSATCTTSRVALITGGRPRFACHPALSATVRFGRVA